MDNISQASRADRDLKSKSKKLHLFLNCKVHEQGLDLDFFNK